MRGFEFAQDLFLLSTATEWPQKTYTHLKAREESFLKKQMYCEPTRLTAVVAAKVVQTVLMKAVLRPLYSM